MGELSKRLDEAGAQNKRLSGELDAQRSLANERGKVLETQKSELSQKITDLEKKLKAATDELERLKASASVKPPTEKVLPRWVRIPAGEFDMGCSPGDKDWEKDELPRHRVTISRASEMSETEITLGTYRRFAEQPGCQMPPKAQFPQQDSHPVVNVTWNEAQDFCKWVGGVCPPRPNGNTPPASAPPIPTMAIWTLLNGTRATPDAGQNPCGPSSLTPGDCLTCWAMCGSGAMTGMVHIRTAQ